tara:strand:+ start:694 stop:834 length:141 start_codon:yes stop_codon:yes gene_type:complete
MTTNNHHEENLKAARRAEIERLWFEEAMRDKELLKEYKALDIKEPN